MKLGRPSKYTDDMPERALANFSEGASIHEVCLTLGICVDTYYDWTNPNSPRYQPAFSEAASKGVKASRGWWEMMARKASFKLPDANGNPIECNSGAMSLNLRNRFPDAWKEKQEVKQTHSFSDMTDDELEQQINSLSGEDD